MQVTPGCSSQLTAIREAVTKVKANLDAKVSADKDDALKKANALCEAFYAHYGKR